MKNIETLVVSERFYSIQGEGQTMGVPAVFIRLAGCNLLCKSKTWICDSIEVWQKGKKTLFEDVLTSEMVSALEHGAHLIFTGGEPLLHQNAICKYIEWFEATYKIQPIIEFETNGTIEPNWFLNMKVNYWNVSPKLQNSGESYERRVFPNVIKNFANLPHAIFKFVVSSSLDVIDVMQDYGEFINMENVVLMPAGENQEQLAITRPIVAEQALNLGVRYSDRLHIVIWNQKTGV
jgi:organic radical activating enzyme